MPSEPRPFSGDAPLLLGGPPGVGKSTVGRQVAVRLGVPFVDLDQAVAEAAGRSVAEIFAGEGEGAFRRREREALLAVLAEPRRQVVALGGGTLVDDDLRGLALARGVVVGLSAPARALAARLAADDTVRPLMVGADPETRIEALLAARRDAYGAAHVHLDGAREAAVVAGDVARAAADRFAWVTAQSGGYPVRLGADAGLGAADAVFALAPTRAVVVSDDHVARLWGGAVAGALAYGGRPLGGAIAMHAGEAHKRLATLEQLSERLLALGVDRRGVLVAVGGGVVSDMTGLLAALYFRGVPWIAVPTTMLAMVDAAIGGKTGVDLEAAKNVLGAFHPPRAVIVDPAQARTEPVRQVRAGLAEALKTALVGDPGLLELLEREADGVATDPALWEEVVRRSLAVKVGIVTRDEHEQGERAHLNLGHTFGHAIETAAGFGTLLHGEAVAIGLLSALKVGVALGVTEPSLPARIERLLERLELPRTASRAVCARATELVGADKKRRGGTVGFVTLRAPGRPVVRWEAIDTIAARLAEAASA